MASEPPVVWTPPPDVRERTEIGRYLAWLAGRGLEFEGYDDLWRWSIQDLEAFWESIWEYFGIRSGAPYSRVLASQRMPGAEWFSGALLNYAEHIVGREHDLERVAVHGRSQTRPPLDLTYGELRDQVAQARAGLARLGVARGDRVVAYLPNIPETLVAFLATASLGAIWASCAPEFGARAVVDRFAQIEPKVLLAVGGYRYGDRPVDRRAEVAAVAEALPTLEHMVHVPYGEFAERDDWSDLLTEPGPLAFEALPFAHPLYVLFSSGTTGPPKAIVHSHGGILVEHLKLHALQWDIRSGDRFFWPTSTAWMMWNALVSGLLVGAEIVTFDGNPAFPDLGALWRAVEETEATMFGTNPAMIALWRKEGRRPAREFDLSRLRVLGSAGSPLPAEAYWWVAEELGPQVFLNNGSGGTDVCSGFTACTPLKPIWAGEMTVRCLGVDAHAFDEAGRPVVGEVGELVIRRPMPSMPVGFWNDPDGSRYRASYFDRYPGVWRHGDWILFTDRGTSVITGRSDTTLNRGGVRLGTGDFYAVLEELDDVVEGLVVHLEDAEGGPGELVLFVVLADGRELDEALCARVRSALRTSLSPRHVPDRIERVPAIPKTLTGKRLELPVKQILMGAPPDEVASRDALADPSALDAFVPHA